MCSAPGDKRNPLVNLEDIGKSIINQKLQDSGPLAKALAEVMEDAAKRKHVSRDWKKFFDNVGNQLTNEQIFSTLFGIDDLEKVLRTQLEKVKG